VGKRLDCVQSKGVHTGSIQSPIQIRQAFEIRPGKTFPSTAARRIQFQHLTSFRILNREQTCVRERAFARVVKVKTNHVVPRVGDAEFLDDVAPGRARHSVRADGGQRTARPTGFRTL